MIVDYICYLYFHQLIQSSDQELRIDFDFYDGSDYFDKNGPPQVGGVREGGGISPSKENDTIQDARFL